MLVRRKRLLSEGVYFEPGGQTASASGVIGGGEEERQGVAQGEAGARGVTGVAAKRDAGEEEWSGAGEGILASEMRKAVVEALVARAREEYERALKELEAMYRKALEKLESQYEAFKRMGVVYVEYEAGGERITLDEWYTREKEQLEKWYRGERERLEKWLREVEEKIREGLFTAEAEALKRLGEIVSRVLGGLAALADAAARLVPQLRSVAVLLERGLGIDPYTVRVPVKTITRALLEAEELSKALERGEWALLERWLGRFIEAAEEARRHGDAGRIAEQARRWVYDYLVSRGVDEHRARTLAEKAYKLIHGLAEKAYREHLGKLVEQVKRRIEELAEKARRTPIGNEGEAYRRAAEAAQIVQAVLGGVADEETVRKLASWAAELVRKAALSAYRRYQALREELDRYTEKLAERLSEEAARLGSSEYQTGRPDVYSVLEELKERAKRMIAEEARRLAEKYRLDPQAVLQGLDLARVLALIDESYTRGRNWARFRREADRLLTEYIDAAAARLRAFARDNDLARLSAALDRLAMDFEDRIRGLAGRLGVDKKYADEYAGAFRAYTEKLLSIATAVARYRDAARRAVDQALADLMATHAPSRNLPVYIERVRERLQALINEALGGLSGDARAVAQRFLEDLAGYYLAYFAAEAARRILDWVEKLPEAAYFCWPASGGVVCNIAYPSGDLYRVTTVSAQTAGWPPAPAEWLAVFTAAGYKPVGGKPLAFDSEEEARQALLAFMRERDPMGYLALLGSKAVEWRGGLTPENLYMQARALLDAIDEFFAVQIDRLAEWSREAVRKGGPMAILGVLGALAAATGMLGAGVVSGVAGAWDVPSTVEFGRQVASGALIEALRRNPLLLPKLAGTLLGGGAALGAGKVRVLPGPLPRLRAALGRAGEALGALHTAALVYGVTQALGAGELGAPLIITAGVALKGKAARALLEEKAVKTARLPLDQAIRLIEEGKASPELEIAGEKYVYVKIATAAGEEPALIPARVWEAVMAGDLAALEELIGRKVLLVDTSGDIPRVVASLTPEEAARLRAELKQEMVAEMEKRIQWLKQRIKTLIEEVKDLAEAVKENPRLREELLARIRELDRLRRELRELSLVDYMELFARREPQAEYRAEGLAEVFDVLAYGEEAPRIRRLMAELEQAMRRVEALLAQYEKAGWRERQRLRQRILEELSEAEERAQLLIDLAPDRVEELLYVLARIDEVRHLLALGERVPPARPATPGEGEGRPVPAAPAKPILEPPKPPATRTIVKPATAYPETPKPVAPTVSTPEHMTFPAETTTPKLRVAQEAGVKTEPGPAAKTLTPPKTIQAQPATIQAPELEAAPTPTLPRTILMPRGKTGQAEAEETETETAPTTAAQPGIAPAAAAAVATAGALATRLARRQRQKTRKPRLPRIYTQPGQTPTAARITMYTSRKTKQREYYVFA